MEDNNSEKYLPLKTAAELYGYTRDHLGLMIRQNKLKGIKLGSYYVTTNGWMTDYIKNFADPNHPTSRGKLSNKFLTEILSSKIKPAKIVAPEDAAESAVSTFSKAPYVILPIRKMENIEREEIFKKAG